LKTVKFYLASLLVILGLAGGLALTIPTTITANATATWKRPSQKKAYPNLKKYKHAYIKVSVAKQRVYLMNGKKSLYTMVCSTGIKTAPTPKGTFHIQNRGQHFYNATVKEGAYYWTSFKGSGAYLFHSVPVNAKGKYIVSEAHKLGQRASHGCVRLSVADAHWIYSHVPYGMTVKIH